MNTHTYPSHTAGLGGDTGAHPTPAASTRFLLWSHSAVRTPQSLTWLEVKDISPSSRSLPPCLQDRPLLSRVEPGAMPLSQPKRLPGTQ